MHRCGHLALGAIDRGAQVLLMSRRNVYGKLFDADPGWIGPKYLKGFWAEPDLHVRWQTLQQARNLSGARAASDRIVPALTKSTIAK